MELTRICVIGGSGFVGSHIVQLLSAQRYHVRVPTRDRERARSLILLPTVDVVNADVHDTAVLADLVRGMDAVIDLVGVLYDGRGERSFEQAHVELTRKIIAACAANGVTRKPRVRRKSWSAHQVSTGRFSVRPSSSAVTIVS